MALFEQFPYTNFHEMNLDWALQVAESAKEHLDGYDEDMATIAQNALDTESWKNAAAGSASAAAASALAASGSAAAAANEVLEAEAWAKGTKNGAAVAASAPQYQNNSKYFSQQSASSASNAAAQVLEAEAWADGEKNGTPVSASAPQYENNAKYWSEQAYIEAQAGALIGVEPYKPYSLGSCIAYQYADPNAITVKASRTLTKADGTTESVNYSGLIAFLEPIDFDAQGIEYSDNIRAAQNAFNIISVTAQSGQYIGIDATVSNVYEIVDGVKHRVRLFRMYDIVNGTFLADNAQMYYLTVVATNGIGSLTYALIRNGDAGQVIN